MEVWTCESVQAGKDSVDAFATQGVEATCGIGPEGVTIRIPIATSSTKIRAAFRLVAPRVVTVYAAELFHEFDKGAVK